MAGSFLPARRAETASAPTCGSGAPSVRTRELSIRRRLAAAPAPRAPIGCGGRTGRCTTACVTGGKVPRNLGGRAECRGRGGGSRGLLLRDERPRGRLPVPRCARRIRAEHSPARGRCGPFRDCSASEEKCDARPDAACSDNPISRHGFRVTMAISKGHTSKQWYFPFCLPSPPHTCPLNRCC
ncbi:uncharacterized protein LOC124418374 [Gallus gallus]|uniref:uncharacterized protein LOC124418374 n=1 Tax=Gallus gallus TaxID=9031 RepID=UPI001F027CC7|nr:uncharacterized protein LOC124418374 [Gallus gallus]